MTAFGVTFAVSLAVLIGPPSDKECKDHFPRYVGRDVCMKCHQTGATTASDAPHQATPCKTEDMPAHDRAYSALEKSEARHIAALSGIAGPTTESLICLSCHATASDEGRRWTAESFDITLGVQCENCHGAGSFHIKAITSGLASLSLGSVSNIRRGDRNDCKRCHIDRPSHERVLKKGFRLSPDDSAYKTPVNLTVSPDGATLFVVCERSNSVVVIDTASHKKTGEVRVGARPHDAACSPDGSVLYVSNRMDASVSIVSIHSLKVIETIAVGHEPHAVLVDPQSNGLIVLNTANNTVSLVPLAGSDRPRTLTAGQGPWSATIDSERNRTVITNVRPNLGRFRDPPKSEITILDNASGHVATRVLVPGANMLQGVSQIPGTDVSVFTLVRSKNLIPTSRLAQGWVITNGLGVLWPGGRVDQVLLDAPARYFPDPMDLAVSPDGKRAIVVSGGANEAAIVDVDALLELLQNSSDRARRDILPNHLGMSDRFVLRRVRVGRNPRAVCYSPNGEFAYIANALDDTISVLETTNYDIVASIDIGGSTSVTHLRRGERIFHSASKTFGGQFSCRSCHPDGHINGLTFDIEADGIGLHPVDNRTLRGILDTPPFKWEGTNPTLHRQCGPRLAVFFTRLDPLAPDELDALVDYMCTIERPPNRFRKPDGLTNAQRRGKAIFERTTLNNGLSMQPQRRCVTCHTGAYMTTLTKSAVSSNMWFDAHIGVDLEDMFGTDDYGELGNYYFVDVGMEDSPFDIPHLRNIADSPPYLHNGAANTLEEIWTRFNMTNRHGATADLTRQQLNDLIAYLKSL